MQTPLRILLVDDNRHFLQAAEDFLQMQPEFSVVAVATDAAQAVIKTEQARPDLILLDLNLQETSGLTLIPAFRRRLPTVKIIVLTIMEEAGYRDPVLEAGADAFVAKQSMSRTLVPAIRQLVQLALPGAEEAAKPAILERLIQNSPDLIYRFEFAPRRGYAFVSRSSAVLTGYTPEEYYADPDLGLKIVHPDDRPQLEAIAFGGDILHETLTLRWMRKDGTVMWMEETDVPVYDSQGQLVAVEGIARDVTGRYQTQERLHLQAAALQAAANAIVITDTDGTIEWVNPAFTTVTGYTAEESIGRNPRDLVRSGVHDRAFYTRMWGTILAGQIWRGELINRRKDGVLYPEEQTITPVFDQEDKITHFVGIKQDITYRKRAEETAAYQTFLLNNIAEAVIALDLKLNVTNWNGGAERLCGWLAPHVVGRPLVETVWRDLPLSQQTQILAVLNAGGQNAFEFTLARQTGPSLPAEARMSCLHGADGRVNGYLLIVTDISERKRAQAAAQRYTASLEQAVVERTADLNRLNAELRQAAQAKDEFLASMSHELRTPLSAILTLAESLSAGTYGDLAPKQTAKLNTIYESGQHLLGLINGILDVSKIAAGKTELHPAAVDLACLTATVIRMLESQAGARGLGLSLDMDPALAGRLPLVADERALKQILMNLLGNAIKFTPQGGSIGLQVRGDVEDGIMRFTVWDTGVGISAEDAARLFRPFEQLASGKGAGGTGLGLALAKGLAELHHGSITVDSAPGQGSRFTVALPWRPE